MQKNSIKASILIWSIFISLIISVTFIQISTKINKNLKNNNKIINQIKINNEIKNIINSGSINKNFTNKYLDNGYKIIYEATDKVTIGLKKGETHISKINNSFSNIYIKILKGGPIKYTNNSESGIIVENKLFYASNGDLLIENMGGYTSLEIVSDKKNDYLSEYTKYEIIKKIGNKEIIKNKGKIKNF